MKLMEEIDDLIEEAKLRTLWWAMLIFIVTYFLSHTSTSMWMNLPVAILLVSALRLLTYKVEFRMKVPSVLPQTYLSHLEKKQLSVNDSRLSYSPPPPKWKRKIDSPLVEAAMHEFIDKILKDFVTDLWYSDITPDKEAPELINAIIMDALGEISGRVKEINLVDLLTRDMVDLIGDHIDLFRRNQAAIGVDVMKTLASDERDERLKHHLMVAGELHPALVSAESEYKVLQRLVSGILAVVLRSRDAQSPLVRCFAREFVTCLVFQPILGFANPVYINEVIGYILLAIKDADCDSFEAGMQVGSSSLEKFYTVSNQATDMTGTKVDDGGERDSNYHQNDQERIEPKPADWARMLEVATQRRTEILAPENLENWWAKGRNYRRKEEKIVNARAKKFASKGSTNVVTEPKMPAKEVWANKTAALVGEEQRIMMGLSPDQIPKDTHFPREFSKWSSFEGESTVQELHDANEPTSDVNKNRLKRSSSTSDLKVEPDSRRMFTADAGGPIISEFYSPDFGRHAEEYKDNSASKIILRNEGQHAPKLRCRVVGAYFEKLGSTSFAVYSIAVTDAENKTWFVKRRYRNFERLHRNLKEIPNYTLHLPPKRIFSSSTEDSFVHQRCIQLDKYLKDLLSIANVAEQHEVWDFFSVSSKNYSFGKSSSVMRTLAVNVDDAVDDIVRQFKGVSDGLMRKVVGSSSASGEASSSITRRNLSWAPDESSKSVPRQNCMETVNSTSDNEEDNKQGSHGRTCAQIDGSLSDNELNLKSSEPELFQNFDVPTGKQRSGVKHEVIGSRIPPAKLLAASTRLEDLTWIPPEWTPSNVSVPLLNLVDKVFQLNRRGWLRRQVFWISKQIIQLVMEDAIDDFLLRQIYWLRKEDTIAQGIRWVQEMLWPGGNFFTAIGPIQGKPNDFQPDEMPSQHSGQFSGTTASTPGSFVQELEAARRASEIKKLLFDGAPAALVGLIGQKQYRRCASDIFYFTQSTTCVKQLAYAMLELVLVSIFPELQDLILDLHGKVRIKNI